MPLHSEQMKSCKTASHMTKVTRVWLLALAPVLLVAMGDTAAAPLKPGSGAPEPAATASGQIIPVPAGITVEHHFIGAGTGQQSGPGNGDGLVYSNTGANLLFALPIANIVIADDIRTEAACDCTLSRFEFTVGGGGDGSGPGFTVDYALYRDCPSTGGEIIEGTAGSYTLDNDAYHLVSVDVSAASMAIPRALWLGIKFDRVGPGWLFGTRAEFGITADYYDMPYTPCTGSFDGTDLHAGFHASIYCLEGAGPAPADIPDPPDSAVHVPNYTSLAWAGDDNSDRATATGEEDAEIPDWVADLEPGQWCGTHERYRATAIQEPPEGGRGGCRLDGECDDPVVRDAYMPDPTTPIKTYRLRMHVFCMDNGSDCAGTPSQVDGQIATLNRDFLPWRIQFEPEIGYVNDSRFRSFNYGEEAAMKNAYADSPDRKLNVYLVFDEDYVSFGTFPWDARATTALGGVVLNELQFGPGNSTLTHEVGHNLGLWHTHHGVSEVDVCGPCYELAGSANDNTGDRCSDTDPTPTNFNCTGPGGTDSCNDTPWGDTDVHNYMGYAGPGCWSEFTTQQAGRLHCWTEDVLSGWLASNCLPTFEVYLDTESPPNTLACDGLATPLCDPGPLDCDTEYFWQVVSSLPFPGGITVGPVWSFSTEGGTPPAPTDPMPLDQALDVPVQTELAWAGSGVRNMYGMLFIAAADTDSLVAFDLQGGAAVPIGPFYGAFGPIAEMEWSPNGRTLYATTGWGNRFIHTIDPATGAVRSSVAHAEGELSGLEFDATGALLAALYSSDQDATELVIVDAATGTHTSVGPTGVGGIAGLAFDDAFTNLYGITTDNPPALLNIDPATGAATPIATTDLPSSASSLEFASDGRLITADTTGDLYQIDETTGATTWLASTGVGAVAGLTFRQGADICSPTYDVYFGTDDPPASLACENAPSPDCAPGPLDCNQTYYWQIVTTSRLTADTTAGPVWTFATPTGPDCNNNGIPDACDIDQGDSSDCNANGVPDECDILECGDDPLCDDCDLNGVPDECDPDCNTNDIPDACEQFSDCNTNHVPDECDIAAGTSHDCNTTGTPDECDVLDGTSGDCNANTVPDECEFFDCGSPSGSCPGQGDCCASAGNGSPGCDCASCCSTVCSYVPECCQVEWFDYCAYVASLFPQSCPCSGEANNDCNLNQQIDECDIADGISNDCNANDTPDECEPDEDCNQNGVRDICDIGASTSDDCNENLVPDECEPDEDCNDNKIQDVCDIFDQVSDDCNWNRVPDECEPDCNENGQADDCDVMFLESQDCNANMIPDSCDVATGQSEDCNANGYPDECDVMGCGDPTGSCPGSGNCCTATGNGTPGCNCSACCAEVCAMDSYCCSGDWDSYCAYLATYVFACRCGDVPIASPNCDDDLVPDECEPAEDCNANNVRDICDIGSGTSADCNQTDVPDECEIDAGTAQDCDQNGIIDECELWTCGDAQGACPGEGDCCTPGGNGSPGCDCASCCVEVCAIFPHCCEVEWDAACASTTTWLDACNCGVPNNDCNQNGSIDTCDIDSGIAQDCNESGVPDACELPGDFNADRSVNLVDLAAFSACLAGPGQTALAPRCCFFDLDSDGDVDLADFAAGLDSYSGP